VANSNKVSTPKDRRRRRRTTPRGGRRRKASSGELVPAVQGMGASTSGTASLLTSTRSSCTVPRRRRDGAGGVRWRWRRLGFGGGAVYLGFGASVRRRAIKGQGSPDARAQVPGQRVGAGKAARSQGATRTGGSSSGSGRRSGMTTGPHLSARRRGRRQRGCAGG
jgi:hypothetical protein